MRALSKSPDARHSNAAEFALALSSCGLAGKWTFGDAVYVAKNSSRPPPPTSVETFRLAPAPRLPRIRSDTGEEDFGVTGATVRRKQS